MNNKSNPNITPLGLCGAIILAVMLLGLWIAGLAGWMAWPVVRYILRDALGYALVGVTLVMNFRWWKRIRPWFLKALILLAAYIVGMGIMTFLRIFEAPEMRTFEKFLHTCASTCAGFAGILVYDVKAKLPHQPIEPTGDGPLTRLLMTGLKKLTPQGFLIGGGIFTLLVALWAYTKGGPSANPYMIPAVAAFGLGAILQGVEIWIAPRFPRLAKGSSMGSVGLVIAGLYFFVRMLSYE